MLSPCWTLFFTSWMASATTALFTVSATMSSDCRIGTPARSRADRVRQNRDIDVLWNRGPKTGTLILNWSIFFRPCGVFLYCRSANQNATLSRMKTHQYLMSALLAPRSSRVGKGSVPPRSA